MLRFCAEDGCPGIANTGSYCQAHQKPSSRTLTRSERHPNDRFYARAAWKGKFGVRAYKWRRNPICEYVEADGTKCTHATEDIHHIDGSWKETGDWTLFLGGKGTLENPCPNLMSLCKKHHSEITMQQIKDGTSCSSQS
jgi:hypothetical protein